jgi:hypothetical protein
MGQLLVMGRSQAHEALRALMHQATPDDSSWTEERLLQHAAGYQRDFSLVLSQLWGACTVALFADGSALYRTRTRPPGAPAETWHVTLDLPPLLPPLQTWVLAYDTQARTWLLSAWRGGAWRTVTLPERSARDAATAAEDLA